MSLSAFRILRSFPIDEVTVLVDELLDDGNDKDEVIDAVVEFLDELLKFGLWLPGPVGVAIETIDGPVLRAAIGLIVAFAGDDESRGERKARRSERKRQRRARREERRAKRDQK